MLRRPLIIERPLTKPFVLLLAGSLLLAGCRIETRPPAGAAQTRSTVQEAVTEHYRARAVQGADSVQYTVLRRQVDVRRDLATAWVTLRETRHGKGGMVTDTTTLEQLLLRRTGDGWIVLTATRAGTP